MRKVFFLFDYRSVMSSLIILYVLFTPFFTYAETEEVYYRCIDKNGAEIMTNNIIPEATCKPIGAFKKMTDQERENDKKEKEEKEIKRTVRYEKEQEAEKKAAEEAAKEKRLRDLEKRTAAAEQAAQNAQTAAAMANQAAKAAAAEAASHRRRP